MRVAELSPESFASQTAGEGVLLCMRPVAVRVRSPLRAFSIQLHALYGDYEINAPDGFAHIDIRMLRVPGLPWHAALVQFLIDGTAPFDPFPLEHALPMFEWGLNWVFAQRTNTHLLLHAAVVERRNRAVLLPAYPGAGKTTLAASLAYRGWRLLSDEFGVVCEGGEHLVPFPRPLALKNASIDVMRNLAPQAPIGPLFEGTRKGTVAHVPAPHDAVKQAGDLARAAAVVFPEFSPEASPKIERLGQTDAFMRLAGHAFNYEVIAEQGFRTVACLVRRCPRYLLRYGNLDAAHAALETLISEVELV
jgi:HprK-related kinase A